MATKMYIGLLLISLVVSDLARAQIPDHTRLIDYTYEIENLSSYPNALVVQHPRACNYDGTANCDVPGSAVSSSVDYHVVDGRKDHRVGWLCRHIGRAYLLDRRRFPTHEDTAKAGNWTLDLKRGERIERVAKLDALNPAQRAELLRHSAESRDLQFNFDTAVQVHERSPLRMIHDVLLIKQARGHRFVLVGAKVVYTYGDGSEETIKYSGPSRPAPTRAHALDPPPYAADDG